MLWLSLIASSRSDMRHESELLRNRQQLPTEECNPYGINVIHYIAQLLSNPRRAANVSAVEIQAETRTVTFEMRDAEDIVFQALESEPATDRMPHSVTVSGTFLCRAAMAYTSRVWLPFETSIYY